MKGLSNSSVVSIKEILWCITTSCDRVAVIYKPTITAFCTYNLTSVTLLLLSFTVSFEGHVDDFVLTDIWCHCLLDDRSTAGWPATSHILSLPHYLRNRCGRSMCWVRVDWWILSLVAPVLRVAVVVCRDEATCQIKHLTLKCVCAGGSDNTNIQLKMKLEGGTSSNYFWYVTLNTIVAWLGQ